MSDHPNTFHLVIASVGETRFDGAAVSVTLPGESGQFTVLPHHEALVTTLKPGTIIVHESIGEPKSYDVESGVIECSGNRVVVLL
jgi:F-type H+-transporting ATPase subunit epsilon